jgi:hypothetical protein
VAQRGHDVVVERCGEIHTYDLAPSTALNGRTSSALHHKATDPKSEPAASEDLRLLDHAARM